MGLFGRGNDDPDKQRAKTLGKRGIAGRANIEHVRATGETRDGGIARELEFRLSVTPEGGSPVSVTHRQFMNSTSATGLEAGEPAEILYDPEDPSTLVITGSPNYRVTETGALVRVEQPSWPDQA